MRRPFSGTRIRLYINKIIVFFCIFMFLASPVTARVWGVYMPPPPGPPTLHAVVRAVPEGFKAPSQFLNGFYRNYVHLSWSRPEHATTVWENGAIEGCWYLPAVRHPDFNNNWCMAIDASSRSFIDGFEVSRLQLENRRLPGYADDKCMTQSYITWEDIFFNNVTALIGEVASFRIIVNDMLLAERPEPSNVSSNIVTLNIGYPTPTIKEIRVTGIPDANNPTTNCPSTAVDEKVKLEAEVDCPAEYVITKYSWSGTHGVEPGEGNPYEYEAAPETYGQQTVTCTISYTNIQYGWSDTATKTKDFKLFFVKDGYDQGNGRPPNWFTYWSKFVQPPATGFPTPEVLYNPFPKSCYIHEETCIHIGSDAANSYNAPLASCNPHDGIDNFVWTVVHETQHYDWFCYYWGNSEAAWKKACRELGPDDDFDMDGLPNKVEDDSRIFDSRSYLTLGCPDKRIKNDQEWENCLIHCDVTGAEYYLLDWANPGKLTQQAAPTQLQIVLADSSASEGPPDLVPSLSPTATFSRVYSDRGVDVDGDSHFEFLEVNAGVNVTAAAKYVISGGLLDTDGNLWLASNGTQLTVGLQSVSLRFDGLSIHNARVNGPYKLVDLTLYDENCSLHDFASEALNTSAYQYSEFKGSPTQFTGVFSDQATDTNGDGAYDRLTVNVGVNSAFSANCRVEGCLCNALGNVISNARDTKLVGVGNNVFSLGFDGLSVFSSRTDGPYSVRYLNLRYENGTQVDFIYDAYNTSALSYASFGGAQAMFTGAYENRTEDTDSDGLFDYLTVGVDVTVKVPGNYTVAGSLCDRNGTELGDASCYAFLNSSGTPEVFLTFQGLPIYEHGVDGPYTLRHLALYDENGTLIDSMDNAFNTTAYAHTSFTNIPEYPTLVVPAFTITTLIAAVVGKRRKSHVRFNRGHLQKI